CFHSNSGQPGEWQGFVHSFTRRNIHIEITENLVTTASGNWKEGREVMVLLLAKDAKTSISEPAIRAIAKHLDAKTMGLLLDKDNTIKVTEEILIAAQGNLRNGREMMRLLLDR